MRAGGVALVVGVLAAASAPARAQCPSCSNPNIAAVPHLALGGVGGAPAVTLRVEGAAVRATRLQQGWGATESTRDLKSATDTLYEHRLTRLSAVVSLGARLSIEGELSYEEREMTNRAFRPQGESGIRRHLLLTGLGDAFLGARLPRARSSFGDPWSAAVTLGAFLPTGATLTAPDVLPVETVMQIGTGNVRPTLRAQAVRRLGGGAFVAGGGDAGWSLPHDAFRRGAGLTVMALGGWAPASGRWAVAAGPHAAWRGADERDGAKLGNTGGETLSLVASTEAALGGGVAAFVTARAPVVAHTTGTQLVEDWAVAVGASVRR